MMYSENLPASEKRHFMQCDCGQYFDMRDLGDVMKHLHPLAPVEAVYSHAVKIGEPVAYPRKGGPFNLS